MKALREYVKDLDNYGLGTEDVITEMGFDDSASYPKITFTRKGYLPEKAADRVQELIDSDAAKIATRQLSPKQAGPALAAPQKATAIAAPAVDEAYEEEAVVEAAPVAKAPKEKPAVAPVKASEELSAKLDSLFDE
jgi:hypothetical protein